MRRPMTVTERRLDAEQVSRLQGLMRKRGLKCEGGRIEGTGQVGRPQGSPRNPPPFDMEAHSTPSHREHLSIHSKDIN